MWRSLLLVMALLLSMGREAAAQLMYSYEGIAFTSKGVVLRNTDLNLRIRIRNSHAKDTVIYEENQSITTDKNGVFFLQIGNGKIISGSMAPCGQKNADHFMRIEMASIGETVGGSIRFKCIKCRLCNLRYMTRRIETPG